MKRYLLLITSMLICSLAIKAQFILTQTEGLKAADNAYCIIRSGSETENYTATLEAVKKVIPEASIEEKEFEKSFTAKGNAKISIKIRSAIKALNFVAPYTLHFELSEKKILVSFVELGCLEYKKKNGVATGWLYPWSGISYALENTFYIFNKDGDLKQPKAKSSIEEWANSLITRIEQEIKK